MEKIKINTGTINLEVECDGVTGVISFNPEDVGFAEGVYKLMADMEIKQNEIRKKEKDATSDEKRLALYKEICIYMRSEIDKLFGEGTSQKIFGNTNTLDMFEQFFDGIAPFIKRARKDKLNKYKTDKKNVME